MSVGPAKTIILFGNCQSQNMYEVLRRNADLTARYRVLYQSAVAGAPSVISAEDIAACEFLFHMGMIKSNSLLSPLEMNGNCKIVLFSSLVLSALYPFYSPSNPYNETRPPEAPWGAFPYGDQAIIDMIDAGLPAAEILEIYLTSWERYAVDLDQMLRLDRVRLAAQDRQSDIAIGDFMLDTFHRTRLFFTPYHPTPALFAEVLGKFMRVCAQVDPALAQVDIAATLAAIVRTSPRGPLGSQLVPVHPNVAAHFSLAWYDPQERFELPGRPTVSYRHFHSAMIAEFMAVKAARARAELPTPSGR